MNVTTKRKVVVTGATRGLGLAIASSLANEDYHVIGVARKISPEFLNLKGEKPELVDFMECDFSDIAQIYIFSKRLYKQHGRVYGLINNAGVGVDGVLSTMHETDIARMIQVNLHAPIVLTKYLSRGMLINKSGRIINISSIIANTGFHGLSAYASTKAGLVGFTRSLSRELGKVGITVNCVSPGFMTTEMTSALASEKLESIRRRSPLSRFPTVDEVATAVSYLLSDSASAITGIVLTVDTGSTA